VQHNPHRDPDGYNNRHAVAKAMNKINKLRMREILIEIIIDFPSFLVRLI